MLALLSINLQRVESTLADTMFSLHERYVYLADALKRSILFSERRHALQTSFATAAQGSPSEIDETQ
jgi:hypothetical protein